MALVVAALSSSSCAELPGQSGPAHSFVAPQPASIAMADEDSPLIGTVRESDGCILLDADSEDESLRVDHRHALGNRSTGRWRDDV